MKNIFSRWGDPEEIACDGGPQFTARCFMDFAKVHNIKVIYSSAYFPQANGAAEAGVKIAKKHSETKGFVQCTKDPSVYTDHSHPLKSFETYDRKTNANTCTVYF